MPIGQTIIPSYILHSIKVLMSVYINGYYRPLLKLILSSLMTITNMLVVVNCNLTEMPVRLLEFCLKFNKYKTLNRFKLKGSLNPIPYFLKL